jgi:2-alkyl-3-oxoalkanoate reductase
MKLAVLGADSCLGARMIELFQLDEGPSVAAVARDPANLTRPARFAVDLRIADPTDPESVARSVSGCSAAIHALQLEPAELRPSVTAFCQAAHQAGLRRLVYCSSAEVHGLSPATGTDEKSALQLRHPFERINALVAAEREFVAQCRDLGLAGLILRPGIIYGPRSDFFARVAADLEHDRATLFHKGEGIYNGVYVDTVVSAVRLGLKAKITDTAAFLITDAETLTWREFYHLVAHELNLSPLAIRYPDQPDDGDPAPYRWEGRSAPPSTATPSEWITRHQCAWKLPNARALKELGLSPTAAAEGVRRGTAWWRFTQGDFSAAA